MEARLRLVSLPMEAKIIIAQYLVQVLFSIESIYLYGDNVCLKLLAMGGMKAK